MNKKILTITFLLTGFLLIASGIHAGPRELGTQMSADGWPDLGDAPDSKNNLGNSMTAYPSIQAKFPTVFNSPNPGPRHENPELLFHLGPVITAEDEADSGFDADSVNNIDPSIDVANQDAGDDGLHLPPILIHCQLIELKYDVRVYNDAPEEAFVNIWFDYDRDGSWRSIPTCGNVPAPEWAVQNEVISLGAPGFHNFTTPSFLVYNPPSDGPMWVRITISESPAPSANGAGPLGGWEIGETEDYLWQPSEASDLGDAPDNSNSHGFTMLTYDNVTAEFPTVYGNGSGAPGPLHINTPLRVNLGDSITREDEADMGYDQDAINNISPAPEAGDAEDDRDGGDDGLTLPLEFNHCDTIELPFSFSWHSAFQMPVYVNAWIDFDRNGSWGDTLYCDGTPVSEWAVQNQAIVNPSAGPGFFTTDTLPFQIHNVPGEQPMWVRITLSESMATDADGRGPADGWSDGETEDYLWEPAYDLAIKDIEVSQGIQDLGNRMTLVEDRQTIVRVYVVENNGRDVENVIARLHGTDDSTGMPLPGSPWNPSNPGGRITVHANGGNRQELGDSFWFVLPRDWRKDTVTLRAEVNYDNTVPEIDHSNNEMEESVTYTDSEPLKLKFVPMHLHDNADRFAPERIYWCTEPDCDDIRNGLLRYHPLAFNDLEFDERSTALYPTRHSGPTFKEWDPTDNGDQLRMLAVLENLRLWNADYSWHYYGTVHRLLWNGGRAFRPGHSGIGMMASTASPTSPWYIGGGRTLAHELGHNLSLKHMPCADNDGDGIPDEESGGAVDWNYPWPLPNCSLSEVTDSGYFAMDVYYYLWGLGGPEIISNDPAAPQPQRGFPMMSYRSLGSISPYEYCELLAQYRNICIWSELFNMRESMNSRALTMAAALDSAEEYLLVSGIVDGDSQTAELFPFYRQKGVAPQQLAETVKHQMLVDSSQTADPWLITLENKAGEILFTYQIPFNVEDHDGALGAAVNATLPFSPETSWIRVRHSGEIIAERRVSTNAPKVSLLVPNDGGQVKVGDTISWTAVDVDQDELFYNVLYSADAGEKWTVLALDTTSTELEISANIMADMPGSNRGMIKVVATDGVNTGADISDRPLIVPDAAPRPTIVSPRNGQIVPPESMLFLTGRASDKEDGLLDKAVLEWESSRDGFLGSDHELLLNNLSLGQHIITLQATDSDGNKSSSSVTIFVGYKSFQPVVIKGNKGH